MSAMPFPNERYSVTVERQMREWELGGGKPPANLAGGGEIDYITISRELGSGGEEIASILAELMNWGVYDKKILDFMTKNFGVHKDVLESVDERTRGWIEETMSLFFGNKSSRHIDQLSYYKHLMEALLVIAKHGRAVIVGRAAGQVLPRERGLSVRVTAPFELRVKRVMEEKQIDMDEATAKVKKADDNQRRFVKDFLSKDAYDTRHYDIVFNTEKLSPTSVARLIRRAFEQRVLSQKEQAQAHAEGQNIAGIVENQMKQWQHRLEESDQPPKHAHLSSGAEIDYITISRRVGSGGSEIARMLSDLMQWQLYDREIINHISENMDVYVKAMESVDEQTKDWIKNRLSPFLTEKPGVNIPKADYYQHLGEALLVIASHGEAIIVGRGGGHILPREKGLNVRVTAPYAIRYRRYAMENNLGIEKAMSIVKKADKDQKRFDKDFLRRDTSDTKYYDITVNTEKLNPTSVARLIWRALEERAVSEQELSKKDE